MGQTLANLSSNSLNDNAIISIESRARCTSASTALNVALSPSMKSRVSPELHGSYEIKSELYAWQLYHTVGQIDRSMGLKWECTKHTLFFNLFIKVCTILCWGVADVELYAMDGGGLVGPSDPNPWESWVLWAPEDAPCPCEADVRRMGAMGMLAPPRSWSKLLSPDLLCKFGRWA